MRRLVYVVVMLVVLVTAIWFATRGEQRTAGSAPTASEDVRGSREEPKTELATSASATPETTRSAPEPAVPADAAASKTAKPTQELSEIRGRFLISGGAPAAGVELELRGFAGNNERVMKFGAPDKWESPKASSGADGRFAIQFDAPRAFQFFLKGKLEGWCEASWRWSEIEPGAVVDVGDVELVRGGSVRGRIVDGKGRSLSKGWSVNADGAQDLSAQGFKGGREPTRARAEIDAATGEFLLQGLPPGLVHLKAYSRIANWIDGPDVQVRAGEETKADIAYTGPDNESRIVVIPFCRPFHVFEGDPKGVFLLADGFETRQAKKVERSSQSFSFEDIPPGFYMVEVRDDRFQPWSKSGVQPGESVNANLKGSAAVRLQVVDEASGAAIERYTLDVRFDNANFGPNTFRILEDKAEPPVGGFFDGLVPHDQTLLVSAPGFAVCEVPAPALAANETRALVARLGRGVTLAGRVIEGGTRLPIEGLSVTLGRTQPENPVGAGRTVLRRPRELETVSSTSDASGRFKFEAVPAGTYDVLAAKSPVLSVFQRVEVGASPEPVEIELVLPASGNLSGRLIGPEGASFEGLRLLVIPKVENTDDRSHPEFELRRVTEGQPSNVGPSGTFRAGPVPAGEARVELHLPSVRIPSGNSGWSSMGAPHVDLGTITIAAGADTQRDFDVRASFPGRVKVTLRVNGTAAPGTYVLIESPEAFHAAGVVQIDASGSGLSGLLQPGTYRTMTMPVDSSWFHVGSATVVVRPGETAAMEIDVALVSGVLEIRDSASGQPAANAGVSFRLEDESNGRHEARGRSDAEGRLRIALPPARYSVSLGGEFPGATVGTGAVVDWTASGPTPGEISLSGQDTPR